MSARLDSFSRSFCVHLDSQICRWGGRGIGGRVAALELSGVFSL